MKIAEEEGELLDLNLPFFFFFLLRNNFKNKFIVKTKVRPFHKVSQVENLLIALRTSQSKAPVNLSYLVILN